MAKITTLAGMKTYVKTMLGYPAINVELPDSTFNQVIEDACQTFARYNEGEGSYKDYVVFSTSAGQQDYPVSAIFNPATQSYIDNVQSVYDFSVAVGLDGINIMFTPSHILLHDQYVTQGAYPGGSMGALGVNDGLTLTNYVTSQMYIKEISNMFGKMYKIIYIPGKDVLRVSPVPNDKYTGVLALNRRSADVELYNHPIVKRLATGKCMQIWGGLVLNKYNGTLPDGMTINGAGIYEMGTKMYDAAEESCWRESAPSGFIFG